MIGTYFCDRSWLPHSKIIPTQEDIMTIIEHLPIDHGTRLQIANQIADQCGHILAKSWLLLACMARWHRVSMAHIPTSRCTVFWISQAWIIRWSHLQMESRGRAKRGQCNLEKSRPGFDYLADYPLNYHVSFNRFMTRPTCSSTCEKLQFPSLHPVT